MFHYHDKTFTSTASGVVIKEVVCERCGLRYYYQMARWAVGSGIAPYCVGEIAAEANAQRQAESRLRASLEDDCEAVPCPQCGRVQQQAIDYIRRHMYPNLRVLAWVLPIIGVCCTLLVLFVARLNNPRHLQEHWQSYFIAAAIWIGLWLLLRGTRNWLIARGNWLQMAIQYAPPALLPEGQPMHHQAVSMR